MDFNFMLMIKAAIIAIVEGITEFIPVSSTGHMIIVGELIKFNGDFANLFEVVIQLGAILAIVVLYRHKFLESIYGIVKGNPTSMKFWINIFVACIPAIILGLLFEDKIDRYLFNTISVACALLFGAILMIIGENTFRRKKNNVDINTMTIGQAFKIGVFQCLALWPGMSRSASTIIGGWISGLSTIAATEFSFFLAIPVMVGASGLKLLKYDQILSSGEILTLAIGFIVAFLVALVCVEGFVNYLKKKPMKVFAYYRIIVAIIFFMLAASKIITV